MANYRDKNLLNISQPILYTPTKQVVNLEGFYNGWPCFLLCSGPSLLRLDLSRIDKRGFLIAAVNNSGAKFIRPHLWFSVDTPNHFHEAIWRDPGIIKFVMENNCGKNFCMMDSTGRKYATQERIYEMPGVIMFRGNKDFCSTSFTSEGTVNWGNHGGTKDSFGHRGGRSVLLSTFRILFYLGVRRLFLLGCDFFMDPNGPQYAFEQRKDSTACQSNNSTYGIIAKRLAAVSSEMARHDFQVFNCNPESKLTVFPFISFDEAIERASKKFPLEINVKKMYNA